MVDVCVSLLLLLYHRVLIVFDWEAIGMGNPVNRTGATSAPAPAAAPVAASAPAPPQYGAYGAAPAAPSYGAPAAPSYGAVPPAAPAYGAPASNPYQSASYGAAPAANPYANYASNQSRGGPVVKEDLSNANIIPISAINPYSNK